MQKVLYIHGHGSTAMSSKTMYVMDKIMRSIGLDLISIEWDENHPKESIFKIEEYVDENKIQYVIGHSLGGFIALCLVNNVKKVIINPALHPSKDLKAVEEFDEKVLAEYKALEDWLDGDRQIPWVSYAANVLALFSKDDDQLHYYKEYCELFSQAFEIPGGHRPTENDLDGVKDMIEMLFS